MFISLIFLDFLASSTGEYITELNSFHLSVSIVNVSDGESA